MENNLILTQLNDIGVQIGYPFYIFKDGSYGKKITNGAMNPIMVVKSRFEVESLQSQALPATPLVQQKAIVSMPLQDVSPISLALRVEEKDFNSFAECGSKVYQGGHILSAAGFSTDKLAGYIFWVNPDKNAPAGVRALCCAAKAEEMKFAALNECEYMEYHCIGTQNIASPHGRENTCGLKGMFAAAKIESKPLEYILGYAQNGLEAGDCFLLSAAELAAVRAQSPKAEVLLALLFGTGAFPTSDYIAKKKGTTAIQVMPDGGCWSGTLPLYESCQKIVPWFWI